MLNSLHNQPHIVKQAGLGAFCHWWVTKVELLSITGCGQLLLHSPCYRRKVASAAALRACVCGEEWGGHCSLDRPSAPGWCGPEAAGAFVRQTGSGTLRRSSLLQNASQLIDWDAAVTSRSCTTPLWIAPAALPCVTFGGSHLQPHTSEAFNLWKASFRHFALP